MWMGVIAPGALSPHIHALIVYHEHDMLIMRKWISNIVCSTRFENNLHQVHSRSKDWKDKKEVHHEFCE